MAATREAAEMLAKRTAMAERQAVRRLAKAAAKDKPAMYPKRELRDNVVYRLHEARVARREDWEKGPLAPRRDVNRTSIPQLKKMLVNNFERRKTPGSTPIVYGAIEKEVAMLDFVPNEWQLEERWAWAGGSKFPNLAVGDRVVVVEGPFKGQISAIKEIFTERGVLTLETAGQVNIRIPGFAEQLVQGQTIMTTPSAFPVSAVRMVHPIPDPQTGEIRDVIIKQLVSAGFYHDRPTRRTSWHRMVPGLNIKIPWPKTPPVERVDHPCDTLRVNVEAKTWVPTLTIPPMPETVLNELRNGFSKFRTRHTEEYLAEKQAEIDAKKARSKMVESMLTPVQEYNKMQRELKASQPAPELTDDMMLKIGEIMARNRGLGGPSKDEVSPNVTRTPVEELTQAVQDVKIEV